MYFAGTVYRNPYRPTWPLLEEAQGCTHNRCKPMVVGTGGLTLFPGTSLLEEAQRGEFDPLSEKEMLEELKRFVENLTCDCAFITHHTISGVNLSGPDFLARKEKIVAALARQIDHGDLDAMAAYRRSKRTL